jgi:glycine hydroxymethyltransferase
MNDKLRKIIERETSRQQNTLGMIPSENYSSKAVREAVGSLLMHKYSEGYPGARYYEGNENIDDLENLARDLAINVMLSQDDESLKSEWHANVQPLSGSVANLAVYNAILEPGDTILSMYLPDGGHLSHGWNYGESDNSDKPINDSRVHYPGDKKVTFVSKVFNVVQYKTDPDTYTFDYDFIENLAKQIKPKLIVTGGTSYPRDIDYKRMSEIAKSCDAMYMADVAHEAGLIAGGSVSSPFRYADFVTFTTHKTLRGPKGAVVMCRKEYAKAIDKSIIPGLLGGPFNHNIAGIIQAFTEASEDSFKKYALQVVKNAQTLASNLAALGLNVVTGGTDKHLLLLEVLNNGYSGTHAARALALANIVVNKNTVPYEKGTPVNPSGIRLGTPLLTTRGMKVGEMKKIAVMIKKVLDVIPEVMSDDMNEFESNMDKNEVIQRIRDEVMSLCVEFPLPE